MLKGTSMSSDAIAEKKYRIHRGTAMNVHEIDQAGRVRLGLCFAPKGFLVMGDAMLTQKIALETFGRRALAVANRCLIVDLQLRSNAGRRRLCVGRLAATSPRLEPPTYRHAFERWISCLMRISTKLLELPGPVRVWIAQTLDVDAARQATFDSCFHKWRRQKCKRERQIGLAKAASFALCQLLGVGD